jgi:two-component system chemotaxis response regulator CheY
MHALVVDDNARERDFVARSLQEVRFTVTEAAEVRHALAALQKQVPDLMVLAWNETSRELMKRVRELPGEVRTYVIAIVDHLSPATVSAVCEADADDFIRRSFSKDELIARSVAIKHGRRSSGRLPVAASERSQAVDVKKLKAYRDSGQVIAGDLEQMFGEIELSPRWPFNGDGLLGARIVLALPSEHLELRTSVAVESKAKGALGEAILGDPEATDDAVRDVLRELANTAAGAVRRVALTEKVTFTPGLPDDGLFPIVDPSRCWTARVKAANLCLGIAADLTSRANERVPAEELKEGMVVAHDLQTATGELILRGGTRITTTAAERVIRLLGAKFLVEVACTTAGAPAGAPHGA